MAVIEDPLECWRGTARSSASSSSTSIPFSLSSFEFLLRDVFLGTLCGNASKMRKTSREQKENWNINDYKWSRGEEERKSNIKIPVVDGPQYKVREHHS